MRIVFVEYSVRDADRETYLAWIREKAERFPQMRVLESTAEPGLFIEIWSVPDASETPVAESPPDEWIRMRKDEGNREWGALIPWIKGGIGKLHVWEFQDVFRGDDRPGAV